MLHRIAPAIPQGSVPVNILTSTGSLPPEIAEYDAWKDGLKWRSVVEIAAGVGPQPCGTADWPDRNGELSTEEIAPFTIRALHGCEGMLEQDESAYRKEAERALDDKAPWLIAREVWMGTQGGQSLRSTATALTGTGGVIGVIEDLVQAHQDATEGGVSIIHMPRRALASVRDYVKRSGNRLLLPDDTVIAAVPGYPGTGTGTGPESEADADDTEVWIYVTGPMLIAQGPDRVDESDHASSARQNLYEVFVSRPVIAAFDSAGVFAGLADLAA